MSYRLLSVCAISCAFALTFQSPGAAAAATGAALSWSPCPDVPGTECTRLVVPVDPAKPNGDKLTIRLGRVPARDQANKKGVIVFLPGGPGAGIGAIFGGDNRKAQHVDELSRNWDLVVFDPRGIGESSPIRCSPQAVPSPPPPSLQPPEREYYENVTRSNAAFFKTCFAQSGELMRHLSSADTAADVEQIRRALTPNEGLIAYAGSYGSAYGQAYLERYPDRVKAMVLDGVVDHSIDFPTFVARNVRSVDDEFDRMVRWCAATASCALHAADVGAVYDDVARAHPELIPVVSQLLAAGSDPEFGWPALAKMLAAAKAGDTAGFEEVRKATTIAGGADPSVAAGKSGLFSGVICADYGAQTDFDALVTDGRAIAGEAPRFAWKFWDYTPNLRASVGVGDCVGWPLAAEYPPHRLRVGLHPNVMVANPTHDPATPLANALSVWLQIPQARLLVADSDGHQSWIVSKCSFQAEERFLGDPQNYPSVTLCPLGDQP
ncbi:MAG TPA: alpha/beta fold hydrolase [Candidatus Tumulicola sp.]|jgi:pimeloyl-ACP methyl ester carboxylesterase